MDNINTGGGGPLTLGFLKRKTGNAQAANATGSESSGVAVPGVWCGGVVCAVAVLC